MKKQLTLLAAGLFSMGLATAQTTTNTYSSTVNATDPTYTSPVTTDSTNAAGTTSNAYSTSPSAMTSSSGTTTGTYSTNSASSPTYGTTTTTTTDTYSTNRADRKTRDKATKDYKNFVFGIYAGPNSTKFKGEAIDANGNRDALTGRLGYQAGFFVRGGGRLYGQLGAEYFASSSNYFTAGDGQSASVIQDQINIRYVQIPVYIGYKLVESDRGISAVRLQVGLEYANRISANSNSFNLSNSEIKSGTFNGLGQLGFDIGPLLIDLTYHHGFSNSIEAVNSTGFAGSQRRVLSASVGFKF
ncbi:outer membrane beta-barrel protein [Spirosoma taeanense]|uniref:Outer membrane beta-barrel protein n=1 Tax=Spirosoma taeanense TaxID=2735870 RepID=A0A6M5YCP0_9BACT|nr:outer membrane beta-barrel protein [Spirosoma taeanense]QJW90702.1 outer membrane beta-barrel protein [Spirosoma taeanense]